MVFTEDKPKPTFQRTQYSLPFPQANNNVTALPYRFAPSNEKARALLDIWSENMVEEPGQGIIITGPPASGKTYTVSWMAHRSEALIVTAHDLPEFLVNPPDRSVIFLDDVDQISEPELIVRFIDVCRGSGKGFLICGNDRPESWAQREDGSILQDLLTRLAALPEAQLDSPDEELMARVLVDWFEARQITLKPELANVAVSGLKRSFLSLAAFAEQLDQEALHRQKAIDRALILAVQEKLTEHILS